MAAKRGARCRDVFRYTAFFGEVTVKSSLCRYSGTNERLNSGSIIKALRASLVLSVTFLSAEAVN